MTDFEKKKKKTDLGIDLIANAFERRYNTQGHFRYFLHSFSIPSSIFSKKRKGAYSCLPSKDSLNYSFIFIQRMVSLMVIVFSTKCFMFVYMYIDLLKLKLSL